MLNVDGLSAGYGRLQIIREVSFVLPVGTTAAVFGRNGAGKTTLTQALLNGVTNHGGSVQWEGVNVTRLPTHRIVRAGIGLVPQTRGLFFQQTVAENLAIGRYGLKLGATEAHERDDRMYGLFPSLSRRKTHRAGSLSGGEQQMLAIAKVLIRNPRLLILDEPSTGLAPAIIAELAHVVTALRSEELTILITEQNVHWVLPIVDTIYVLDQGRISETIDCSAGERPPADYLVSRFLGDVH